MARLGGLAPRDARGDHHGAELARLVRGKREDVGRPSLPSILPVEDAEARIRNDGDGHRAPGARRRNRFDPPGQTGRADATRGDHVNGEPGRHPWSADSYAPRTP